MIYVNSLLYLKCHLIIFPFVPLYAEALDAVMLSELISRFTCVCTYITAPSVCVCLHLDMLCVRGCVWFLCNIPNLSNFGARWEALLFSWRSRRATKTVVHFGNRLKL